MLRHISEIIPEVLAEIEARRANPNILSGIPSGFKALDWITDGFQKEFYIVGGRTSMGKSAIVKDFVLNAATSGHSVHIVNLEDADKNTVKRQLSAQTGVDLWKMKKGNLSDDNMRVIYKFSEAFCKLDISFEDSAYDANAIEAVCVNAISEGVGLLVIDYLQLIRGNGQGKRYEQLQEISHLLKRYAKQIPILGVVQINREVEKRVNKRPTLSDIRECGDIEQDADVVLLLYREGYYSQDYKNTTAELNIAKGRNCGTGQVKLEFNDQTASFWEPAEPEYEDHYGD